MKTQWTLYKSKNYVQKGRIAYLFCLNSVFSNCPVSFIMKLLVHRSIKVCDNYPFVSDIFTTEKKQVPCNRIHLCN